MYLKVSDGLTFGIRKYTNDKKLRETHNDWCKVDIIVKYKDIINYELLNDESLESYEIDMIIRELENLKNGNTTKEKYLTFTEPIIEFKLYPAIDGSDESGEFILLIDNMSLNFFLDKEELEKLLLYLELQTGKINNQDNKIQELLLLGDIF